MKMTKIPRVYFKIILPFLFLCGVLVFCSGRFPENDGRMESENTVTELQPTSSQEPVDFTCHHAGVTEYNSDSCIPIITFQKNEVCNDKYSSKNLEYTKNMDPFLECLSCMTIAKELSKAIFLHNEEYDKLPQRKKENFPFPCYLDLKEVCARNFISFDLQEKNCKKVLAPSSFNGKHVPVQGINWREKLEELCLLYVSHYGIKNINDELITNSESGLIDELCNKTGLFGSCQSIEDECNKKL